MADEQLTPISRVSLLVESCALLVLASVVMVLWPSSVTEDIYAFAHALQIENQGEKTLSLSDVERPETTSTLRWTITGELPGDTPLALQMSGPFSASIYFNGEEIGHKGEPGADASAERAGPIDFLVAIPSAKVNPASNEVVLVLSSHKAGYEPSLIVQSLMVVPFQPDQRRDLRYYAALILTSGMLVGLIAVVVYLCRERSFRPGLWIAVSLVGLLIAGGAEVSRSLINYPYDWHQFRQAVQFAGFLIASGALALFTRDRWLPTVLPTTVLGSAIVLAALGAFFSQTGYDARSVLLILLVTAMTVMWIVAGLWRNKATEAVVLLPLLVAILVLCLIEPGFYLDQTAYVLAAVFFGHLLARRAQVLVPLPSTAPEPVTFAVPATGRTIYLPLQDIIALKAAGNYTEIYMRDGQITLDGRSLAVVIEALPGTFMRVHRSWGVNTAEVEALQTRPGSRYFLTMTAGDDVPVGRSQINAVRERLG